MGAIALIVLLAVEVFFFAWAITSGKNHAQEKGIVRIAELALLGILLLTAVLSWGFRYSLILFVLAIQAAIGVIVLVRKTEKPYKLSKNVFGLIRNALLYAVALAPLILFLEYTQPATTGIYQVETAKYTWTDESRTETFSKNGGSRALTVDFWYPKGIDGSAPLIVFSHGAFGFSGSNQSTFEELASHGYVVASIGHTYHAFYTMDTSGNITTVNTDFLSSVYKINAIDDPEQEYYATRDWMNLRVADERFVLDTLSEIANEGSEDPLLSVIDMEHIGVIGHSLGGASFAQLARERDDIDAVINLDGSMLGEEIGFENGKVILNDTPFPVPLLNIYTEGHYQQAMEFVGDAYENFYASKNALCAYEITFKDAGHLNFTDLPLFSPTLAKMLGIGTIDPCYCIETTNQLVLAFFDCYVKGGDTPIFEKEY